MSANQSPGRASIPGNAAVSVAPAPWVPGGRASGNILASFRALDCQAPARTPVGVPPHGSRAGPSRGFRERRLLSRSSSRPLHLPHLVDGVHPRTDAHVAMASPSPHARGDHEPAETTRERIARLGHVSKAGG